MDASTKVARSLNTREKAVSALAVAAAVLCFSPWIELRMGGGMGSVIQSLSDMPHATVQMSGSMSANGFKFVEGVLAFLASICAAVALPLDALGIVTLGRRRAGAVVLVASGLAVLLMLVFIGRSSSSELPEVGFTWGRSIWFYGAMLMASGATFFAYRECRAMQST